MLLLIDSLFGDSAPDQGETCTTPCSVFRVLHFAVSFDVRIEPTEVAQDGAKQLNFFLLFLFLSCLAFLLGVALGFSPHTVSESKASTGTLEQENSKRFMYL